MTNLGEVCFRKRLTKPIYRYRTIVLEIVHGAYTQHGQELPYSGVIFTSRQNLWNMNETVLQQGNSLSMSVDGTYKLHFGELFLHKRHLISLRRMGVDWYWGYIGKVWKWQIRPPILSLVLHVHSVRVCSCVHFTVWNSHLQIPIIFWKWIAPCGMLNRSRWNNPKVS